MAVAELTSAVAVATAFDAERIVGTMVRAFADDPVIRWLYPGQREYRAWWPEMMRLYCGGSVAHETAFIAEGGAGAALWLPPGATPDEEALGTLLGSSVAAERQPEVFAFLEQMGVLHPSAPHWYLAFVGVDPLHQGRGHGSALLRAALERCDRDRLPAYLEATTLDSRRLYERHGFEVVGVIQAGASPSMWPMLRAAR